MSNSRTALDTMTQATKPAAREFLPTRRSLLTRLKRWDDQESWRDFFNTYWKLVYGVALKSGLSESEAQEVVQETVISVAKKMPGFKVRPGSGLVQKLAATSHPAADRRSIPETATRNGVPGGCYGPDHPHGGGRQDPRSGESRIEHRLGPRMAAEPAGCGLNNCEGQGFAAAMTRSSSFMYSRNGRCNGSRAPWA